MTAINDNVQTAIDSTVASSAVDITTLVDSLATRTPLSEDPSSVASPVSTQHGSEDKQHSQQPKGKETPRAGSTAIGLPNPAAVDAAVEDAEKKKEEEDSVPSSTATGLPAPAPVLDAAKENDDTSKESKPKESKRESLKKVVDTVAHAPATAAQKVIKKVTPSKSADAPSSDSSSGDQQQQQRRQSETSSYKEDKQDKDTYSSSVEAVQAAITSTADNGAVEPTTCLPPSNDTQSTHTPIDGTTGSQAVEPVVEHIPAPVEAVEEPAVETAVIEKPPARPTPADVKAEQLPNLEDRATNAAPAPSLVSEEPTAIGQVTHSQNPATGVEETKVESPLSEDLTKASANQSELLPSDLKTEQVHAAEEPVAANDIKADASTVEPIKDDRPIAVDQISVPVSNSDDVKADPMQQSEERNTDKDSAIKTEGSSRQEATDPESTLTADIQAQSKSMASVSQEPPAQTTTPEPESIAPASQEPSAQVTTPEPKSTTTDENEPVAATSSTQATPEPKSRGLSSPEHPPAAADTKDLPPQPSSGSEQQPPKGTSKSSCTIMWIVISLLWIVSLYLIPLFTDLPYVFK